MLLEMPTGSDPDVFAYLDYRGYLRALYASRKRRGASYRSFARRAGLRSPNYLKLVIDGERNLSARMAEQFGRACDLSGEALRYFVHLVTFNQARSSEARTSAHASLRRLRGKSRFAELDEALDVYHSLWYLPAVRELVASPRFREDPRWLARQLLPPITTQEARGALSVLHELGLVVRDERGKLRQARLTVTTGPEARSRQLKSFHRAMMDHAKSSIERIAADERDISSLTPGLGEHGLGLVKKTIQRFRQELLEHTEMEADGSQVVQLNFQLFPLTRAVQPPRTGTRKGAS
jgi:uncharacterized protein (TIGR02147 family)